MLQIAGAGQIGYPKQERQIQREIEPMTAREALILKWQTLGPSAIDQSRLDAAKAALASAMPQSPDRPIGLVSADIADAYANASRAFDVAMSEWHLAYASIFHDPSVIAKLDIINALTVDGPRKLVLIDNVMEYLRSNNLWMQIKGAQSVSPGAAAAVDYNSDVRATSINFELPIVQSMIADLKSHGLLSDADIAALNAMSVMQIAWWQSVGFTSPIGTGDLESIFVDTGEALT